MRLPVVRRCRIAFYGRQTASRGNLACSLAVMHLCTLLDLWPVVLQNNNYKDVNEGYPRRFGSIHAHPYIIYTIQAFKQRPG